MDSNHEQVDEKDLRRKRHLEVYNNSSILVGDDDIVKTIWFEGKQSKEAQARYKKITESFAKGFLDNKIEAAKSARIGSIFESTLLEVHKKALEEVVISVTAQRGRALVEILVLQLAIKVVCPEQDVRLHKGSRDSKVNNTAKNVKSSKRTFTSLTEDNGDSDQRSRFSWKEGVSMRHLDDAFIVPILRKHGLLRMNEYGAFMTRTFAENYPFSFFYKAEISGAKKKWLEIIDELEEGNLDPDAALLYVLDLLWKSSEQFKKLTEETLKKLEEWITKYSHPSIRDVSTLIAHHIDKSEARARLLEVAIHSLLQALEDLRIDLGGKLKPLMPMRTANQKHRNYGDVEVVYGDLVTESWDAKYDNPYLSDALDVFIEKIRGKDISELKFGYVLLPEKKEYQDVYRKIAAITDEYGIGIQIFSFDEWVQEQLVRAKEEDALEAAVAIEWLRAYTESLALQRESRAPIDEPTHDWLQSLQSILGTYGNNMNNDVFQRMF